MLNQLDVLIGFAVVMAVVSLLITLVTQMVSAALGLRGKYLAEALEAMIHKIDPTISEEISDLGRNLAGWILTHPLVGSVRDGKLLLPFAPMNFSKSYRM
jgi:hypothetical protein